MAAYFTADLHFGHKNIIRFDIMSGFMEYLKWYHFVIGYIITIIMSQLIARRFSKKIFKDSMITTYNMEV